MTTIHSAFADALHGRYELEREPGRGAQRALQPVPARAHLHHGGEPDKALNLLEQLLKVPYYGSPGWLRIDPTFAPLRGNPRFEQLVEGTT